ncbi:hypothetical protein Vadar_009207 [Vaccinium darrowii]|uniref:Uncharacterized protein n=1 Tax=Vaccinium darrowii TaxID=229202 RepID=A0ACB7Y629_9ERIC|nr:hypothetical protein Vadar_009207 [Vaccinium darrowii]
MDLRGKATGNDFHSMFTLFVDNLPDDVSIAWFKNLFNKFGVVRDAFIPLKRSKVTGRRFGFVRYNCSVSADVAITKTNGLWIEDRQLFVKIASFEAKGAYEDQKKKVQEQVKGGDTQRKEINKPLFPAETNNTEYNVKVQEEEDYNLSIDSLTSSMGSDPREFQRSPMEDDEAGEEDEVEASLDKATKSDEVSKKVQNVPIAGDDIFEIHGDKQKHDSEILFTQLPWVTEGINLQEVVAENLCKGNREGDGSFGPLISRGADSNPLQDNISSNVEAQFHNELEEILSQLVQQCDDGSTPGTKICIRREQKDGPVVGKLKMGAASHPGAVPGRWKDPKPLFTGVSNIASAEGILPSPTPQNSVLLKTEDNLEVAVVEIVNRKPYACKAFVKFEPTKAQGSMASPKTTRAYTFDITKAEEIFDQLMADKLLRFSVGHKIPSPVEIKGKEYCKYHNSWNHTTVNCIIFRNAIQDRIDKGDFKFPKAAKKGMAVDEDPFPADFGANMVHVDMRGAPRTAPRQKISLGAPSQAAKGKQILHDSDNSPDDHPSLV